MTTNANVVFLSVDMGKYKRKLGSRRYKDYDENVVSMALQSMRDGMSSRRAEEVYKVPRKTLLNKLKGNHSGDIGRPKCLTNIEERHLVDVLIASAEFGSPMTEFDLRMLVKNYLEERGVVLTVFKNNLPGREWAAAFLKRHKDRLTKRHCQNIKRSRAEKSPEEFEAYFQNLEKTLQGVSPASILNYDETNLSDNPGKQFPP